MILTTAAKVQILDKMAQLKSEKAKGLFKAKKAKPFDFKPIIDLIKKPMQKKNFLQTYMQLLVISII